MPGRGQSWFAQLSDADQQRLIGATRAIESLLDPQPADPTSYVLRQHQPRAMGWVVQRHGAPK